MQVDNTKDKDDGKKEQASGLSSNPKHILEDEAQKKTAKTT